MPEEKCLHDTFFCFYRYRIYPSASCECEVFLNVGIGSVEFFRTWIEERIKRVPLKLKDKSKLREVLAHHDTARTFWGNLLRQSNAE